MMNINEMLICTGVFPEWQISLTEPNIFLITPAISDYPKESLQSAIQKTQSNGNKYRHYRKKKQKWGLLSRQS